MNLSYANVASTLALVATLGGTSYAAVTITGRDVRDGSLTSADVRDRSLLAKDFRRGQLRRGPAGPVGARGRTGDPGVPGVAGARGEKGDPGELTGNAGGALTGSYPAPGIAAGAIGPAALAQGAVTPDKLGVIPSTKVSGASGTAGTTISWGSEFWDTAAMHDNTAPGRIVARYPGVYAITFNVAYQSACTTTCTMQIEKATAPSTSPSIIAAHSNPAVTAVPTYQSVSTLTALQPDDFITARVTSGTPSTSGAESTSLTVTWVGRLQ